MNLKNTNKNKKPEDPKLIDNPDYIIKIVDAAQAKKNKNTGNSVIDNSINKKPIDYGTKKGKSRNKVKTAIVSVLCAAVIFTSGMAVHKISTSPKKDFINSRVDYYYEMMNHTGEEGKRIENSYQYRADNESYVDYSISPLIDYIVDASKISESEVRCAILAAYIVINEPYREEIFDKTFAAIARDKQLCESLPSYLTMSSWKAYINSLGYNNTTEYNNNERKNLYILDEVNANGRGGR